LRQFVTWVVLAASMVTALSTIADGVHALMDLISTL
jgi:membrane-associated phospholipid phosphatase